MKWENRIIGHGNEDPKDLAMHCLNFRRHPGYQKKIVDESLSGLGWIRPVLANLRKGKQWPKGERNVKTVVDGHLRVDRALHHKQTSIPVDYVDLSPDEERTALAVLDPSSELAELDQDTFGQLIAELETGSDTLDDFFGNLIDADELADALEAQADTDTEPMADNAEAIGEALTMASGSGFMSDMVSIRVQIPPDSVEDVTDMLDSFMGVTWQRG